MRTMKHWAFAAIAASALALAGCGGGGGSSQTSLSGSPGGGNDDPPPATQETANMVTLPSGHGITEAGMHEIEAGMTYKVAGVRFSCPAGDSGCTVTVSVDEEGAVSAEWSGAEPTVAALDATGYQSFANLSGALLAAAQRGDLMSNLYHDEADVAADSTATPPVEAEDNGGGVTSSLTTHEEPGSQGDADPLTGVSDIFVSVDPSEVRASEDHASKEVQVVDLDTSNDENGDEDNPPGGFDQLRDPWEIMNPVLVDDEGNVITTRTANFVATADWDLNPAAEWMTDPALMGATQNMDADEDDIWLSYFQLQQTLAGGRTLHLDLRSDFDPNNTGTVTGMAIARGPSDDRTPAKVPVDADMVSFDGITVGHGMEVDIPSAGVKGSYMGVRGTFTCENGTTDNEGDICRVNQHTAGELSPSEDSDTLVFKPDVYTPDTDWITAGVWLTTPDDPEGDYAIGAFVFGNMPYQPADATAANGLTGTASYAGEAFGRYAEAHGEHKETGRFTADAALTADFGAADAAGSIQGDLSNFVANGQAEDWSVNFESAALAMGMNDDDPPQVIDGSTLRFNAGASGHANGHGLTGYWNGQFYGPATDADGSVQPGSAAGTFGLTTERDNEDNYSLTMGGAFVTHKEAAE